MLSGYRLFVLALALTLSGPSEGREAQGEQIPPQQDSAGQLERIASAVEKLQKAAQPDQGCRKGEDKRQSDLCAQWKAADAAADSAYWGAASFWASFVIGICTLIAAGLAARWAKKAADASADDVRPWVIGEIKLASGIYRDRNGRAVIHFNGVATNFGTSPACNVRLHICVTDKIDLDWGNQFKNSRGGTHSVLRPGGYLDEGLIAPVFNDESVEEPSSIYLRISIIYHRVGKPDILYFEEHYRVHAAIPGPMAGGWFKPSGIGNEPIPVMLFPVAQSSIVT